MPPRKNILKMVLLGGDVFFVYSALFLTLVMRHARIDFWTEINTELYLVQFSLIYIFWIFLLYILDFYEVSVPDGARDRFRNLAAFLIGALVAGALYFYFRPKIGIAPKTTLVLNVAIFGLLLVGWRLFLMKISFLGYGSGGGAASQNKISLAELDEAWFLKTIARQDKLYAAARAIIDFCSGIAGGILLLIIFPPMFLIIKTTSPGPIFYSQTRVGKDGKHFTLYKFRTMVEDAEKEGPQWAQEKDARATNVGYFLRRTHLDELPQALNLLRGEISLVGPRPERPEFTSPLAKEIAHYHLRELVKPGIFGWAQLNFPYGDSVEDAREKLAYDLFYIQNRSLPLDIMIFLKSIKIIFFARGQ
ncbi:MAG: hypothetical protein A2667_01150 [Candidatus Wildermuthbacteria bacterium RIFCSPHIGHO2_01_FULL_47_27]|uniref:Bacterial sugar transferase domain-containing protein n=2 Tax=Candidatus Wildermuthiibacteriota TaxID=1817923 RepID=A0A1G2RNW7_9BACT|nr:MAG: hypothetical protein A2667_01150 [Candidatus Wildermuthbacteria bacterium RIFCSPHIGHO2_01_FULL_47_27]OHA66903.1 MAG: hypothetical protein A3D59_04685 [Candidatus Wildermuthbacteria bacterium RIFCSPHIGHO2_02_FULL_47_17]OHA74565.1 MAG: hypothetical protein A3A32_02725 [Candidatus Wildermuthbacteria bacterium RIFCSPLOWO2_01_FULL_48_35]